jgi:hypothetical protein
LTKFTPPQFAFSLVVLLHTFFLLGVRAGLPGVFASGETPNYGNNWASHVEKLGTSKLDRAASVCTERLARFFPEAEPAEVRAQLTPLRNGAGTVCESVLVEFASAEKAIFQSSLPLEFNDRVQLEQSNGSAKAEGTVIAVQYHDGQKAVAVQFVNGQSAWVNKP